MTAPDQVIRRQQALALLKDPQSNVMRNICATLSCEPDDVQDVEALISGLTNLSICFTVKGERYVYRHPGRGTEEIVNRRAETHALSIARDLGLDATYIHEDPQEGWKLSHFIEGCVPFDYSDPGHVARAMQLAARLHHSGTSSPWSFDFHQEAIVIQGMLERIGYPLPQGFQQLRAKIDRLHAHMAADHVDPVLCHNDFYGPNLLVKGDDMWLIDWEYSAMGDPACDIGNFVSQGSGYDPQQTVAILPFYYGREPNQQEILHCLAAVAVVGYYWFVWAMYKDAMGNPVGEWLDIWLKAAQDYSVVALEGYDALNKEV
ncbi:MAG: phosphotransferase [Coriobacteriales bacterium]|nr:phosphotransferase [Coriobacteriales bacterium]